MARQTIADLLDRDVLKAKAVRMLRHDTYSPEMNVQVSLALDWYDMAHKFAESLAREFDLTVAQTCGIIAVLSSDTTWDQNMKHARNFCLGLPAGRYPAMMMQKCRKIQDLSYVQACDIDAVAAIVAKEGKKTWCFAHNIFAPESSQHVTIDRWMCRVFELSDRAMNNVYVYRLLAGIIREIAQEMGEQPLQTQAVLWVLVRGTGEGTYRPSLRGDK